MSPLGLVVMVFPPLTAKLCDFSRSWLLDPVTIEHKIAKVCSGRMRCSLGDSVVHNHSLIYNEYKDVWVCSPSAADGRFIPLVMQDLF